MAAEPISPQTEQAALEALTDSIVESTRTLALLLERRSELAHEAVLLHERAIDVQSDLKRMTQ